MLPRADGGSEAALKDAGAQLQRGVDELAKAFRERGEAEAKRAKAVEALRVALPELENIADWSGSAGNWPLQDAIVAVRAAVAEIAP